MNRRVILRLAAIGLLPSLALIPMTLSRHAASIEGARGDGRTDDTRAVQRFLERSLGARATIPAGDYLVMGLDLDCRGRDVDLTFAPGARLIAASGVGPAPVLNIRNPGRVRLEGLDIDARNSAGVGLAVSNTRRSLAGPVVLGRARVINVQGPTRGGSAAAGIRIGGDFGVVRLEEPVIDRVWSARSGDPVARGLLCGRDGPHRGYVRRLEVIRPRISHIGPSDDADGVFHNAGGAADSETLIEGGRFEDCLKRAIKTQSGRTVWMGGEVYRSAGARAARTGQEISCQSGDLEASGQTFIYESGHDAPLALYGVGDYASPVIGPSRIRDFRAVSRDGAPLQWIAAVLTRHQGRRANATRPPQAVAIGPGRVEGAPVLGFVTLTAMGVGHSAVQATIELIDIDASLVSPMQDDRAAIVYGRLERESGRRAGALVRYSGPRPGEGSREVLSADRGLEIRWEEASSPGA